MTKIRRNKFNLLMLLIVLLALFGSFFYNNPLQTDKSYEKIPKSSGYWIMNPIYIEDSMGMGSQYTWDEAVLEPWCSGNGSALNPYTIENVTIDAGGAESAIYVENSNGKFFTIRNCTLMYTGTNLMGNAGVKLDNTSNGTIEENIFLHNIKFGVYLIDSNYNVIRNNYMYNTSHGAIRLDTSSYNNVTNNEIEEGGGSLFSSGIYISTSSHFNQILFNNVSNVRDGIEIFSGCHNNTISNSYITSIQYDGIIVNSGANNNTFTENIIDNTDDGITVQGNGNMIYSNYMSNNVQNGNDDGQFNSWDNGTIGNYWDDYLGDDLNDDGIGDDAYDVPGAAGSKDYFPIWDDGPEPIYIDGDATGVGAHNWTWAENQPWCTGSGILTSPYVIEGISRDGKGNGFCISVQNSQVYFEVRDCYFYNAGFTWPDTAILLNNVGNATIIGNDLRDSNFVGIRMDNCDYNLIIGNNASFTDLGLIMTNSEFNYVLDNYVYDAIENAFNIDDSSHNNTVSGNTAINNQLGISVFNGGHNNTVVGNTLINNAWAGIGLIGNADGNYVYNNEISDNNIGLSIPISDSQFNTIYNNTFTLNDLHAEDASLKNKWNLGTLGNYWDNYTGSDLDDDGIGDTPHVVSGAAGSIDYFPIWDDGDDTNPTISINSPSGGTLFGNDAPTYNLNIFDLNLNMSWYTLNSTATRYFFTPANGVNVIAIDETAWDTFTSGQILMSFYVNDSAGNPASVSNLIMKDAILPAITVNSPLGGSTFGSDAPIFNLTIFDINLFEAEYSISPSLISESFSPINGINIVPIDENSWDALAEGTYTFTFSVSDTVGNIRTIQVIITKELPSPEPEPAIPFGNYYLIFLGIGIFTILIIFIKRIKYT
ncbi:MAG: nitrous oxide reductase family maturation protein NosD [Candidatus Hermodarchaeota archaeon]